MKRPGARRRTVTPQDPLYEQRLVCALPPAMFRKLEPVGLWKYRSMCNGTAEAEHTTLWCFHMRRLVHTS